MLLCLVLGFGNGACGSDDGSHKFSERELIDRASPSTVYLRSKVGGDIVKATGVVYDAPQGIVMTAAHGVWGASEIAVRTGNGLQAHGVIAARDACDDLAVLALHPRLASLTSLRIGAAGNLRPGDPVTALGYVPAGPSSGAVLSATKGDVSAVGTKAELDPDFPALSPLIEHQAPVDASASGGPLLNDRGELLGLNISLPGNTARTSYAMSSEQIKRRLGGNYRVGERGFYAPQGRRSHCHHELESFTQEQHPDYKPGGHGHKMEMMEEGHSH